jgi:hypothetical protein
MSRDRFAYTIAHEVARITLYVGLCESRRYRRLDRRLAENIIVYDTE